MSRDKKIQDLEKQLQQLKREEAATYAEAPGRSRSLERPFNGLPKKLWVFLVLGIALVVAFVAISRMDFVGLISGSSYKEQKSMVVERLQELDQLTTAEAVTTVIIQRENNELFGQEIGFPIPGTFRKVLVEVPGTVRAGIDMSEVTENDVELDEEAMTATITVPKPKLLGQPTIMNDQVKVYSIEGLLRDEASITEGFEIASEAQKLMVERAQSIGLLSLAETNAEKVLQDMFQLVEYEVTIEFEE